MFKLRINSGKNDNLAKLTPVKQSKVVLSPITLRKKASLNATPNSVGASNNTTFVNSSLSLDKPLSRSNSQNNRSTKLQHERILNLKSLTPSNSRFRARQPQHSSSSSSNNNPDETESMDQFDCTCILCTTNILKRSHSYKAPSTTTNTDNNWLGFDTKKFFNYLDNLKPTMKVDRESSMSSNNNGLSTNNTQNNSLFSFNANSVIMDPAESVSHENENATRLLSKSSRIKLWNMPEDYIKTRQRHQATDSRLISLGKSMSNPNPTTLKRTPPKILHGSQRIHPNHNHSHHHHHPMVEVLPAPRLQIEKKKQPSPEPVIVNPAINETRAVKNQQYNESHLDNMWTTNMPDSSSGVGFYYNNPPTTPEPQLISVSMIPKSRSFKAAYN